MSQKTPLTLEAATGSGRRTRERNVCPVCGTSSLKVFFRLSEVPLQCNLLWSTREQALQCPKGDIHLAFCDHCGCITNVAFESKLLEYDLSYENSLHFSPLFRDYARASASDLIERYQLRDKVIVEIGSGKGEFLALLCQLGNNRGIGFDPTYVNGRVETSVGRGITFINDFYSERYAACTCDFVCCRQVLEHIPDPREFLLSVRRATGSNPNTAVFFEVPNALFTLRELGIWDIIYPHCLYLTAASLRRLFTSCGFNVSQLKEGFGGQYLCIEALPREKGTGCCSNADDGLPLLEHYIATFGENYRNRVKESGQVLERLHRAQKRAIVWGAGSKGTSFLNIFREQSELEYAVDINPHKHGKYVPGTGQQIMAPEFLREYRPDAIITTNPNYRDEIAGQVRSLGVQPELIVV